MKRLYLEWKRKQLMLKIDKLNMQVWHTPNLLMDIYELEMKLKSLNEYLGYKNK